MTQELYDLLFRWAEMNIKRGYSDVAKAAAEEALLRYLETTYKQGKRRRLRFRWPWY